MFSDSLKKKSTLYLLPQKKHVFFFCEGQHVMGGGEFWHA